MKDSYTTNKSTSLFQVPIIANFNHLHNLGIGFQSSELDDLRPTPLWAEIMTFSNVDLISNPARDFSCEHAELEVHDLGLIEVVIFQHVLG